MDSYFESSVGNFKDAEEGSPNQSSEFENKKLEKGLKKTDDSMRE